MAKQIKSFWLKLTACFLTLYFAPLGHFIISLFGIRSTDGKAYAGTVYCDNYPATKTECPGHSGNVAGGVTIRCTCLTDSSKVNDLECIPEYRGAWPHEYDVAHFKESGCYSVNACSPNGSTQDCSTASQYCTQTCTGGVWGVKVWGNCKAGYVKINNACTAECSISNGKGYEYEESSSSSSSSEI